MPLSAVMEFADEAKYYSDLTQDSVSAIIRVPDSDLHFNSIISDVPTDNLLY